MKGGWRMEESLRSPYLWFNHVIHDMWKVPKGPPQPFSLILPTFSSCWWCDLKWVGPPGARCLSRQSVSLMRSPTPPSWAHHHHHHHHHHRHHHHHHHHLALLNINFVVYSPYPHLLIQEAIKNLFVCQQVVSTWCWSLANAFDYQVVCWETWVHFHFMQGLLSSFISFSVVKIFMSTLLRAVHTSKAI